MKISKILTSMQTMERLIRDRKKGHKDEDEKATLMEIRVPLAKALGSAQLAGTLLQHPVAHQVYLRAMMDLLYSKGPSKEGPDSSGRAIAKPQAPKPPTLAPGADIDL
jgi:hypothetical protein